MAKQNSSHHYLQIPIDSPEVATEAGKLRRHLFSLQKLAMEGIRESDDLEESELEAFKAVFALIIGLQKIEDENVQNPIGIGSESPP
jgi:hypothetical protein